MHPERIVDSEGNYTEGDEDEDALIDPICLIIPVIIIIMLFLYRHHINHLLHHKKD